MHIPQKTHGDWKLKVIMKPPLAPLVPPHVVVMAGGGGIGIMNNISSLVANRIELARNTVYALMPTGMHEENGLSPVAIHKLVMTFVLPRMLHGLDSVILKQEDVQTLDSQYSKILRNQLSLREKMAKEAVYLLFGLLPIEAEINVTLRGNHQAPPTLTTSWGSI